MVSPDEALPARANVRIPEIISQFYSLVHPTFTVSQVGRLRCSKVGSKAFFNNSQSDSVCKVYEAAICDDPWSAEAGNDNLHNDLSAFSVLGRSKEIYSR